MICNIQLLIDPNWSREMLASLCTRKGAVSRHIVEQNEKKYVFGWDQPLMSFFLQIHDLVRDEEDQIAVWLGSTAETKMHNIEDLVLAAQQHGLLINHRTQVELYREKYGGV